MNDFTAVNGQIMTDDAMTELEAAYAAGEFPAGEHSVGDVIHGSPRSLSAEGMVVLSVKIPAAMKRAIQVQAEREHTTPSTLVRSLIARSLVDA
ncbi:MAG: hypothetical protein PUK59_03380 [Actinomycetaceae bacterium]|nr:hypothetical protein [Actinomycetaceae bacterium]MDY5854383.1 hypothetical protein [Arcanobacterium sp.]